jgi:hypothetical protein
VSDQHGSPDREATWVPPQRSRAVEPDVVDGDRDPSPLSPNVDHELGLYFTNGLPCRRLKKEVLAFPNTIHGVPRSALSVYTDRAIESRILQEEIGEVTL